MKTYVYMMVAGGFLKIGVSKDPVARLKTMQTGNPYVITIKALIPFNSRSQAFGYESYLHEIFSEKHYIGEWFHWGGLIDHFHKKRKQLNREYGLDLSDGCVMSSDTLDYIFSDWIQERGKARKTRQIRENKKQRSKELREQQEWDEEENLMLDYDF